MNQSLHKQRQLENEIQSHPGYVYRKNREAHSRSLSLYGKNFKELSGFIDLIEDANQYFSGGWHDDRNKELFFELHRLFHNYVAGAETLVSHTRSYIKHNHNDDEVGSKYEEEITNRFKNFPPSVVIKDFRNYVIHKGLPTSSVNIVLYTDGRKPDIKILLPVEELLKSKRWTSVSKEYLTKQGKYLWLRKLLAAYHNTVYEFYIWFNNMLNEHHASDTSDYEVLHQRLIELRESMR